MTLYERIRQRRLELNMSQETLAHKMGYTSRSTIAKIEAGKNDISQSKIIEFAKALNTTPADLMGWNDPVKPGDELISAEEGQKMLIEAFKKEGLLKDGQDLSEEQYQQAINVLKVLFGNLDD